MHNNFGNYSSHNYIKIRWTLNFFLKILNIVYTLEVESSSNKIEHRYIYAPHDQEHRLPCLNMDFSRNKLPFFQAPSPPPPR